MIHDEDPIEQRIRLIDAKNLAYRERNQCVAGMAWMAVQLGYLAGIGEHQEDTGVSACPYVVYIDLPIGQVSWHITRSELPLFSFLSSYDGEWDGHTNEQKYERLKKITQLSYS